jgi:hypothetical protein
MIKYYYIVLSLFLQAKNDFVYIFNLRIPEVNLLTTAHNRSPNVVPAMQQMRDFCSCEKDLNFLLAPTFSYCRRSGVNFCTLEKPNVLVIHWFDCFIDCTNCFYNLLSEGFN